MTRKMKSLECRRAIYHKSQLISFCKQMETNAEVFSATNLHLSSKTSNMSKLTKCLAARPSNRLKRIKSKGTRNYLRTLSTRPIIKEFTRIII